MQALGVYRRSVGLRVRFLQLYPHRRILRTFHDSATTLQMP